MSSGACGVRAAFISTGPVCDAILNCPEGCFVLPIGRFKGTKEDIDFLGFTFFNTRTKGGKYRLGDRTSKKKLKAKKQAAKVTPVLCGETAL